MAEFSVAAPARVRVRGVYPRTRWQDDKPTQEQATTSDGVPMWDVLARMEDDAMRDVDVRVRVAAGERPLGDVRSGADVVFSGLRVVAWSSGRRSGFYFVADSVAGVER